jgi:chromate reductase, NAD(P)H dehydrogenase (quinone)
VILLVSGSLRDGSVNTAVVRTLAAIGDEVGVATSTYEGMGALPWFDPDLDSEPLPPGVGELRAAVGAAHAVLFCTPEYAGALPGSFKNLLDWLVGSAEGYRRPVAWINASSAPTGARDAHASLRTVLSYLHTDIVEEAVTEIPVPRSAIGADGLVGDEAIRARLAEVLRTLSAHEASLEGK